MSLRTAESIVGPFILLTYLAFGVYGMRLEYRLRKLQTQSPPRKDRWNPLYYQPEAATLLRRDRLWSRLRIPFWLGLFLLLNWLPQLLS